MPLPVTALYAGLMGLWLIGLGYEVTRRRRHDVSVGDGVVRALELAEGMGAPAWVLHGFGLMLVAGRLLHGGYFLGGARRLALRATGMLLTVGMIAAVALGPVFHALARIW